MAPTLTTGENMTTIENLLKRALVVIQATEDHGRFRDGFLRDLALEVLKDSKKLIVEKTDLEEERA